MERTLRLTVITLGLVATGCAAAPLDGGGGSGGGDAGDSGTPTTGIYRLTESRSGSCQPTIADDTIDASVVAARPDTLALFMTGPWFGPPAFGISWITLFAQGNVTQDDDYCNVMLHRVLTIEQTSADHVRARRVDTFSDVAAAASGPGACPPAALPAGDCTQTIELDYVLTQPCAGSCIQLGPVVDPNAPAPSLSCDC